MNCDNDVEKMGGKKKAAQRAAFLAIRGLEYVQEFYRQCPWIGGPYVSIRESAQPLIMVIKGASSKKVATSSAELKVLVNLDVVEQANLPTDILVIPWSTVKIHGVRESVTVFRCVADIHSIESDPVPWSRFELAIEFRKPGSTVGASTHCTSRRPVITRACTVDPVRTRTINDEILIIVRKLGVGRDYIATDCAGKLSCTSRIRCR